MRPAVLLIALALCVAARPHSINIDHTPHHFTPNLPGASLSSSPSSPPRAANNWRAASTVIMGGGVLSLGYYSVNVSIGTPGTEFTLLLDTGSSNLAIPDVNCDDSCGDNTRYDPFDSSSSEIIDFEDDWCQVCSPWDESGSNCPYGQPYEASNEADWCGYGISYGGGSSYIQGYLVNDEVTFGGFTVNNTFVSIIREIPDESFTTAPVDGIIGLAHELNACNPTWAPTIFGQIVDNNEDMDDLFGLCLDPSNGGVIDMGYIDNSKYTGEIQWVAVVQPRWYNMALLDVALNGTSIGMPSFTYSWVNDQIGTFIDSGTSIILFGPSTFSAFQSTFQSMFCDLPFVCSDQNLFNGYCPSQSELAPYIDQFPNIDFNFLGDDGESEVWVSVPASSYLMPANNQYCLGVQGVIGISGVLGDLFMENFYIVHDRANNRIGFADIDHCL